MKYIYTLLLATLLLESTPFCAQNAGDYRSASTGEWSTISNLGNLRRRFPAAGLGCSDGTSSGLITIQSPMTVSVTTTVPVTADELVIESGATLYIAETDFDVLNGAGEDLVCQGNPLYPGGNHDEQRRGTLRIGFHLRLGIQFRTRRLRYVYHGWQLGSRLRGDEATEPSRHFVNNTSIDFNNIGFGNSLTINNSAVFLNNGTVAFSNDADLATTLGGTFQNGRTLEVTNLPHSISPPTLRFNGGPTLPFIIVGSVAFLSQTHNVGGALIIDNGANIGGANTVSFSGHTLTNNSSVFLDMLKMTGGFHPGIGRYRYHPAPRDRWSRC